MIKKLFLLCLCSTFLEGSVFFTEEMTNSHLKTYNEQEKIAIEKDLQLVRSVCEAKETSDRRIYLATAGGPGSRKSTILERFLKKHPEYQDCTYLDPDQRGLKFMAHTYYAQSLSAFSCALEKDYAMVQKKAYDKWRGASNYITISLIEEALSKGKSIIHGTTSTGGHVPSFHQILKENDYTIVLLLCSCDTETVRQAITYRNENQRFYQSTPEDVVNKGKYFPQKFPTYLAYADTLYFFWSDDLFTEERLAAVMKNGEVVIEDVEAFEKFKNKFENDRELLREEGTEVPSWSELFN